MHSNHPAGEGSLLGKSELGNACMAQTCRSPQHMMICVTHEGEDVSSEWDRWRADCRKSVSQLQQDRKEVHDMHVNEKMDEARSQFHHKFATNQKAANKVINKAHSHSSVTALKGSQGRIVHNPMQITPDDVRTLCGTSNASQP